jgi:hypothetical protein
MFRVYWYSYRYSNSSCLSVENRTIGTREMMYTNYVLLHSKKLLEHIMKMSRSGALEVNKAAKKHVTFAFIRILI